MSKQILKYIVITNNSLTIHANHVDLDQRLHGLLFVCIRPLTQDSPSLEFSWRAVLLRHCERHWQSLHWRRWRLNIPLCSCALSWLRSDYLGTMVGRAAVVARQKVQCCLLSNELKTHVLQTCTCRIKSLGEKSAMRNGFLRFFSPSLH